jgi:hypothetical protein
MERSGTEELNEDAIKELQQQQSVLILTALSEWTKLQ